MVIKSSTGSRWQRLCVPLPEPDRKLKVLCFRSFPRPFSGWGPATVSSHNWSSRPIVSVSVLGLIVLQQIRRRGCLSYQWWDPGSGLKKRLAWEGKFMEGHGLKDEQVIGVMRNVDRWWESKCKQMTWRLDRDGVEIRFPLTRGPRELGDSSMKGDTWHYFVCVGQENHVTGRFRKGSVPEYPSFHPSRKRKPFEFLRITKVGLLDSTLFLELCDSIEQPVSGTQCSKRTDH